MGTYNLPRNVKGEGRILFVFTGKSFIYAYEVVNLYKSVSKIVFITITSLLFLFVKINKKNHFLYILLQLK